MRDSGGSLLSGGTSSSNSNNNFNDTFDLDDSSAGNGGSKRFRDSQRVLNEDLTVDQIVSLEQRLAEGGGMVTSDLLSGISRQEPIIYVTINREHNLIIVRTSDTQAMDDIATLIQEIDRPTPQVLLEMKILELTLGDDHRSVFDFEVMAGAGTTGPDSGTTLNPLGGSSATSTIFGIGNNALEDGTLIYQYLNDEIRSRIQFFDQHNRVSTLATPVILASNNRTAKVFVGEERVLTTGVNTSLVTPASGATSTTVEPITETREIGTTLEILPKINADDTVTLVINQDSSTVLPDSTSIPVTGANGNIQGFLIDSINTANLEGVVVSKNGLTIAIGGLIRETNTNTERKVPGLSEIPVLGKLFRKEAKTYSKTELILLITPHIITAPYAEGDIMTELKMKQLSDHSYWEGDKIKDETPLENQKVNKSFLKETKLQEKGEVKKYVKKFNKIKGKILFVDKKLNFATIDLGKKDGLVLGKIVHVYRNDQLVGQVKVGSLRENVSALHPMKDGGLNKIKKGDNIKLIN